MHESTEESEEESADLASVNVGRGAQVSTEESEERARDVSIEVSTEEKEEREEGKERGESALLPLHQQLSLSPAAGG